MGIRPLIGLLAILALGGCFAPIVVNPHATGGGSCAGVSGRHCLPGEFCDLEAGKCHGFETAGVCVPQHQICPKDSRPVCGCNGYTYSNDCMRIAAGEQKVHDGECRGSPCGGHATGCPHPCGEGAKQHCPHGKQDCQHEKQGCPLERRG